MLVSSLCPAVEGKERFAYPNLRELPSTSGCYTLSTIDDVVVYIGQSKNIAHRASQHFDDPEKRSKTPDGVAFWCYYRCAAELDLNRLERGWLNSHLTEEGRLPYFNTQSGPV